MTRCSAGHLGVGRPSMYLPFFKMEKAMQHWTRTTTVSCMLALLLIVILCIGELYAATRLKSQYVSTKEYSTLSRWFLTGTRERGTMVSFDDRGYHSVQPGVTRNELTEKLKLRYPNEFDPKKITWVLTDDDEAFFYRLEPNWSGTAFLFALTCIIFLFPVHLFLSRRASPFLVHG